MRTAEEMKLEIKKESVMKNLIKILMVIFISSLASNSFAHSGRTDANGGHNCSESSKRKGLCYGYHYHIDTLKQNVSKDVKQLLEKKI
tara:strand:+ start:56 stop:319 length:264 start_codon:yes stop_codon:yes gene_type:complete